MRSSGWMRSQIPAPIGNTLFAFASFRNCRLHRFEPLGLLRRQVVCLRKVGLEVIEFPDILARIPGSQSRTHGKPRRQRAEGAGKPVVLIDATAAVVVEVLGVLVAGCLGVGEAVGHADAVNRILLEAVHHLGRVDVEDVVDGRRNVVDVMELRARRLVGLDTRGPGDRQRIARAAEVRGDELGILERRIAGPCPACMIHIVDLGPAERIQTTQFVQRLKLLLNRVGNLVLRQQLADAAVLAFGAGTVVAEDIDHDRIIANALAVQFVDHLAGLGIDMFHEACEHLHQTPLKRPLRLGNAVPSRHALGSRRKLRTRRDPAQLLLTFEGALAQSIPAVVKPAFVLVGPFLEDMVRPMSGTGSPVHQEGFVGRERAMLAHPGNGLVRHVFAQMVLLIMRGLNGVEILDQARLPLRSLAGQKTVEVIEADTLTGRPKGERTHRRGLGCRCVVPFAEGSSLVAIGAKHLR